MLSQRRREPEDMDDPALATERLHGALTGLERINFVSASARIVWSPIVRLARELKTDRLRVLDIATGAGDIPRALWRRARRAGLKLEIHGIDVSRRSVGFAREYAERCQAVIAFDELNVLTDNLPMGFDVVMASLFLHHLSDEQVVLVLSKMRAAARRLVIVNDLRRGLDGIVLAYVACHVLSRSPVVHVDGPRSVRAAFTAAELGQLTASARMHDARITRHWPCRLRLTWRRLE